MKFDYKIVSLALACAIAFSSCTNFLDEKPYGQLTSDQIDDTSIEGLLSAAYAGLEAHFFGNNESFTAPASNWVFDVRSEWHIREVEESGRDAPTPLEISI